MPETRQLAAIMFTDIVGYTALMGKDETAAYQLLKKNRQVQKPIIEKHNGKWLKEIGDGVLASFPTVSEAVYCAKEIQEACNTEPDLKLRIGIHLGEVIFEDDDVFGDGVNIASRLEPLAPVGGIYVSESVFRNIENKKGIEADFVKEETLKNVKHPVKIYEVKVEKVIKQTEPQEEKKNRSKIPYISVGALIVIIAILLIWKYLPKQPTEELEKSIAVLPFKTIGGDPEGEYFAEGVQEEILNHLSRIEDLHVKSRTSVEKFKNRSPTTNELVSELQLTHYLEGSTRKEGGKIRITVQLIDANNDDHLWTENYDRDYENIWDTQSEIAKKIAEALRVSISPEVVLEIDKKPTENPKAWDDFLKAMYYWRRFTSLRKKEELRKMVGFLKTSVRKDPNFALGYSYLALAYQQQSDDPEIVYEFINPDSVLILCNRAIELDPSISEPYLQRAEYYAYNHQDTIAAIRDYKQAIANGPHLPTPYWKYGRFLWKQHWDVAAALKLAFQGLKQKPESYLLAKILSEIGWYYLEVADYQKAEFYMDKAFIYDPDNISLMAKTTQLYKVTGQYDKLFSMAQRIMEISPLNRGLWELGVYYLMVNDYAQSIEYFDQYFTKASETAILGGMEENHMYGYALLKMGHIKEANEKFDYVLNLIREDEQGALTPDYEYAKIYLVKGMTDSAYYHLERVVDGPIYWGMSDFMVRDPLFENIKDEPEFQRLVQVAKEKVSSKREEVRRLENSGEIPASLDQIELF